MTEARVDDGAPAITGAVRRAYGGDSERLFGIHPSGVKALRISAFLSSAILGKAMRRNIR